MKNHFFGVALVVTCGVMTACQEQEVDTSHAATESTEASVDSQPAMKLGDAFNIEDDIARALDVTTLFDVSAPLLCAVDSINETTASEPVIVSQSAKVRFSGFVEAISLDQPSILILRSDEMTYFVNNTPTTERADIAASKGIQEGSAFDYSTYAALDSVQPGSYTIELVVKEGDGYRRCSSSAVATVQ